MGKGLPDQKTTIHQRPQASAAGGGDRYSLVARSPVAAPHGPLCSVSFPYVAACCSRAIRGTPGSAHGKPDASGAQRKRPRHIGDNQKFEEGDETDGGVLIFRYG
jgi:hypothetical protein